MGKEKIFLEKNIISSLLAIFFGVAMLTSTGMTRGIYPFLVFALMVGLGLLMGISAILKHPNNPVAKLSLKEILLILSLFITPVFAKILGFYTSSFLEICAISLLIAPKRDKKSIVKIVGFALVATFLTYVIFTLGLRIRCPRGALLLF
jgi:hypothetical protein